MVTITPAEAVALVRKNLDELDLNGSAMYDPSASLGDNASMDSLIRRMLPEAINSVHLAAPSYLLEGDNATIADATLSEDGVLTFSLGSGSKYLRLVAFKTLHSPVVIADPIPEASPEGRKQLNGYIRGREDRPRLVLMQGFNTEPKFKFYSVSNPETVQSASAEIEFCKYVQEQFYADDATSYDISRRLRQNIIDYLTAIVMDTYSDQRSQSYYQRANNFPTI